MDSIFRKSFDEFHRKVSDFGILNSLAQLTIKMLAPGVPDVYQGTELWDLSHVDPDNRRPVNYEERMAFLDDLEGRKATSDELIPYLWQKRYDGQIKLWLTHLLLNERKAQPDVFSAGLYIPIEVSGKYKDNIFSFARRHGDAWYVVVVPLHTAAICREADELFGFDWEETRIQLPASALTEWENLVSAEKGKDHVRILVNDLFQQFPLAILKMHHPANARSAGILLPVTSLPSAFWYR